jgi:AAA+ ATPase superfamily predicted ATPase
MPNPFFYGGKVSPNFFVGRSQQLRRIFSCLEIANTGQLQSISIVGPHRIGRSSLLNYITVKNERYLQSPELYRFAYISPHNANCHTVGEFLCTVLDELGLLMHTHHNATLQEFQNAIFLLNQSGIHPIICLDEFEDLLNTNSFSDDFFDVLRHLMSESALAFVIASIHPLSDLVSADKYTSPFFNIFTIIEIGEFIVDQKIDEANLIVDWGRHSDYPFSDPDARRMRKMAGQHPYKLQLAGSLIYQAKMAGTVNWKSVTKNFKAQLKQAGLVKDHSKAILQKLEVFVASVGYALLELRRSTDEISESSALWWGVGIIIFMLLVIFGIIPVSLFLKFGSHWLGK